MPENRDKLNLKLDLGKVRALLADRPRVDVKMAVGDKEITVLEVIRKQPLDPNDLVSDNVNVLC